METSTVEIDGRTVYIRYSKDEAEKKELHTLAEQTKVLMVMVAGTGKTGLYLVSVTEIGSYTFIALVTRSRLELSEKGNHMLQHHLYERSLS